jgi:hypothetical protein
MTTTEPADGDALERRYFTSLEVSRLREQVYRRPVSTVPSADLTDLVRAEAELAALSRAAAGAVAGRRGTYELRGGDTTGLEATVEVQMSEVPTAAYHLLDAADQPLLTVRVHNAGEDRRRVRVTSFLDGYSARAVDTAEVERGDDWVVRQLPAAFLDRVRHVTEITTAAVNVLVEDLDGKVELHRTTTVRLLPRTTATLAVHDPSTGRRIDLSRHLGAFVTPNAAEVRTFLSAVVAHHPDRGLVGYQGQIEDVEPQVRAVFAALDEAGLTYVNSVLAMSPEEGVTRQRVRLPRESLSERQANCLDGTVLVASILEAISLSAAIVLLPGHAVVAWETWSGTDEWRHLETTMIGSGSFEEACACAEKLVAAYPPPDGTDDPDRLRRWPLRTLRTRHRILPME